MTRQTTSPLATLPIGFSIWSIYEYTERIRRGEMILDAPYQRGRRWTDDQRIALMRSWLQGVPIPAVVLNDRTAAAWHASDPDAHTTYAVIDGRQRLETALAWQDGDLAIPASWLPADWIRLAEDSDDGPYVRVTGLRTPRRITRLMDLPCVRARVDTVADEATIYQLINGTGTPQTDADLHRAALIANPPPPRSTNR
ncbi:DUF262 domain-containing protein [Micromonospora sp. DT233]|uniref:DUF262 domain-containing protein n=1 Tax=Micromonospora sp. DT233 TaxID=3393432 RepID=UPI003CE935F8